MNYYYKRCIAALLAVFLLAAAAPNASAAKYDGTFANLCKFFLSLNWPVSAAVGERCEKVGVPLSVFPNANGYAGGSVTEAAAALQEAQDYYDKVKKDFEEKEKKLSELKEKLEEAQGWDAVKIQEEIDRLEKEKEADAKKLAECEKNKEYWQGKLDEYAKYGTEDWEKMVPDLKKYYGDMAKNASEMASNAAKDLEAVADKKENLQKEWNAKLASINAAEADGSMSAEEAQKARDEANAYFGKEKAELEMYEEKYQNEYNTQTANAATYSNLAENATAADAQTYYTNEATINAQSAANSYDEVVAHQNQLASELDSLNHKFDGVANDSGLTSEGMHNLVNEYNDAESAYQNAYSDLQGAEQELNAAQQAYNNAQGGSSGGGTATPAEPQSCDEQIKDCQSGCKPDDKKCWEKCATIC
ncbi:MAG: hypothetical protein J6V32_05340 [Elusimicrobiaceae bacterium]|nr:hypothetical protein [Elusimicrobiaceae bacterium]